jgi:ribosomal protein S18 acetylase RimI-like enzyme
MDFRIVEENLRQSFRALAVGRAEGCVAEWPGLSMASLGVRFQMFNAAFLSGAADSGTDLEQRLGKARQFFNGKGQPWAFWCCENWLGWRARFRLEHTCDRLGLRTVAEMPGMAAKVLSPPKRRLPELELRPVDSAAVLGDFRGVGSLCFHVPAGWFAEVFDWTDPALRPEFRSFVGYLDGVPVATSAYVPSEGAVGLYNIATVPAQRAKGIGEAITRATVDAALRECGPAAIVLQSTIAGRSLYERLGFRTVAQISVFNS